MRTDGDSQGKDRGVEGEPDGPRDPALVRLTRFARDAATVRPRTAAGQAGTTVVGFSGALDCRA